jgi:hypothetical protein
VEHLASFRFLLFWNPSSWSSSPSSTMLTTTITTTTTITITTIIITTTITITWMEDNQNCFKMSFSVYFTNVCFLFYDLKIKLKNDCQYKYCRFFIVGKRLNSLTLFFSQTGWRQLFLCFLKSAFELKLHLKQNHQFFVSIFGRHRYKHKQGFSIFLTLPKILLLIIKRFAALFIV